MNHPIDEVMHGGLVTWKTISLILIGFLVVLCLFILKILN